jgi:hypothetical protein
MKPIREMNLAEYLDWLQRRVIYERWFAPARSYN